MQSFDEEFEFLNSNLNLMTVTDLATSKR